MTELNKILTANEEFSKYFKHGKLPIPPSRKLAILACMDARLTVEHFLGLDTGDAHIIRNAGGIATDDAIRSYYIP
jgi:carbonic anhydrase